MLLKIDQLVGLVKLGLATYQAIKAAVVAGRVAIAEADDQPISADRLDARFTAVLAHSFGVGDEAVARIEARQ